MHILFLHFIFSKTRMCHTTDGILFLVKLGSSYHLSLLMHVNIKSSIMKTFSGLEDNTRDNSSILFTCEEINQYGSGGRGGGGACVYEGFQSYMFNNIFQGDASRRLVLHNFKARLRT